MHSYRISANIEMVIEGDDAEDARETLRGELDDLGVDHCLIVQVIREGGLNPSGRG